VSPLRLPGVSQLLAVARLPIHAAPASASVTSGNFHATTTEASVFARSVCSVMWGSAQADRSINASGSLPRTPSPAFGLGPRLFRASHRVSSEPRRPAPVPPGPPDPRSGHRHRGRRDGLRTDRPTPTGRGDGALRSPALPCPPGFEPPPALRNQGVPTRHQRPTPPRQAPPLFGTVDAHLVGPGDGALRSPALPRPRTRPPGSSESVPRPQGSASRPSGRGRPSPGWFRSYAPRISGDRGRCGHRFRPVLPTGQDGNDRKATDAVMRFRLLTRETLRRVRDAPRELIPALGRLRATPCRHARNAVNPRPVAGCNKPATHTRRKPSRWCETTRAEQEPAPGGAGPTRACLRACSPELTRVRYIGGRDPNPTRGGANARRLRRCTERSEGEVKATRAAFRSFGYGRQT
jgi:hypothetical protein